MFASLVRLITLGDVGPDGDFRDEILRGTDPRKAAYKSLVEAGEKAVPALIAQIDHPRVREALAEIGLPAVEPLLALLDGDTAASAANTLSQMNAPRSSVSNLSETVSGALFRRLQAEINNPQAHPNTLFALAKAHNTLNPIKHYTEPKIAYDLLLSRVIRSADDEQQQFTNMALLDWLSSWSYLNSEAGVMAFARVWRVNQSPPMPGIRERLARDANTRRLLIETDARLPPVPNAPPLPPLPEPPVSIPYKPLDPARLPGQVGRAPSSPSAPTVSPASSQPPQPPPPAAPTIGSKTFIDWLFLLESPDAMTAGDAATALGDLGDRRAFLPLIKCIAPDHPFAPKARAALALGKLGSKAAITPLQTLADARLDTSTTYAAEEAIEMLKGQS